MRHEIKYFLEKTRSESVIAFVLSNFTRDGLLDLFEKLEECDQETEYRWHNVYFNSYNKENQS